MAHVPRPKITNHIVQLPPRQDNVGLNVNGYNRKPGATVLHSMVGTLRGTDGYFQRADCPALTDFGIGQVDVGGGYAEIIQWCDFSGRVEPWASGPVVKPEGDGPRWLTHIGGAGSVNEVGVSIEHDDTTLANGTTGPLGAAEATAAQWSASVWLQAWLHAEIFFQTATTYDWNLHHREICGHEYKDCPRPRIYAHTDEYQTAVKAVMARYQQGTPYPAGGLFVNGLRLALPGAGAVAPPVTDPGFPGALTPTGELVINGISPTPDPGHLVVVEAIEATGRNEKGEHYSIKWEGHAWGPWRRVG